MTTGREMSFVQPEVPPTNGVAAAISAYAVRAELDRILADPVFHNSKRCCSLLQFIVERTLEGRHHALKERVIGIEVFERSPDYDPGLDAIVRVAAAEVRKRLALYYKEPAHNQALRIELPLRAYVAEFKPLVERNAPADAMVASPAAASSPLAESAPAGLRQRPRVGPRVYGWALLGIVVVLVAAAGIRHLGATPSALDQFWAPLLHHDDPIAVMVNMLDESDRDVRMRKRDLSAAATLISFLGTRDQTSVLRYSGGTRLDDLKRQTVVFLGGGVTNELAARLGNGLQYQFRQDSDLRWIEDSNRPTHREWRTDLSRPFEERKDYALITRALDRSTGQWWIGISGLSAFGTVLAQQLVIDADAMAALSQQFPQGWPQKNLQVVLELDVVNKSPGAARVIASHAW
jgi:hypothetical protein